MGRGGRVFCVYLLAAGGRIAYAGSSGRIEERLRRHFRGSPLRPAEVSGPTPPTSWRAQGVGRWRLHGRRGYTKPTGRPTPRGPRQETEEVPPGVVRLTGRGLRVSPPPPGKEEHERPTSPPKLKPRAETWDGVRDGGHNSQKTSFARIRLGDLDLSGCRPVSLYLWGSSYVRGPWRTARGVKSLQFIMHRDIYHRHG